MSNKPGFESALQALRGLDTPGRERLLHTMAQTDPDVVEQLRAALFDFNDLTKLEPSILRNIAEEIKDDVWALAFRNIDETVRNAVYAQMTTRRSDAIKELLESMGPQPLSKVQEAQAEIIKLIES